MAYTLQEQNKFQEILHFFSTNKMHCVVQEQKLWFAHVQNESQLFALLK